jgi:tellurite resistance protein
MFAGPGGKPGGGRNTQPIGTMSLFHKAEENSAPFSEKESVVALLFLTVTADGTIAPCEEELVIAASNRMKLLKDLAIPEFNSAVQKVRDAIDAKGRPEAFAAGVRGIPADLKETVYALAADIVFADGVGQAEELSFLREMQEALGVPDDLATKVVEVVRIKNRG